MKKTFNYIFLLLLCSLGGYVLFDLVKAFKEISHIKELRSIPSSTFVANKCLIDFIDPQDGEGSWEDEVNIIHFINENKLDVVPASPYSESNHLYVLDAPCSTFKLESDLIENIEPQAKYKVNPIAPHEVLENGLTNSVPNDPLYQHQWNFKQINVEEAWANSRMGEGAIVAVIDTGVGYKDHGEFKALEDMHQTSFVSGKTFSSGLPDGLDDHAHGSHVAGTIAQSTNNKMGVAGIAPKATIMPLKVLSAQGYGTTEDIASAIRYAADQGAHVINMSLGGPYPSKIMEDAVNYAHEKGVVVICAAGNESSSNVGYPAGYDKCLSVSATDKNKNPSWYTNYGDIDVAAPGGDTRNHAYDGILQNTLDPRRRGEQGYFAFQGTSMASPHAAGVAALIVGEGVHDNEEVINVLKSSSVFPEDQAGQHGKDYYGAGIVNAHNAVLMARGSDKETVPLSRLLLIGLIGLLLSGFVVFQSYRNMSNLRNELEDFDDEDEDLD